jgi:twitching motility protein PilT
MLTSWVQQAWALGASDLHLEAESPVVARIRGELKIIGNPLSGEALLEATRTLLGNEGWAELRARGSADSSEVIAGIRCRINFFHTIRGLALAARLLAPSIKDLRACNLHRDFQRLIDASSGLVVIAGPTGSGKSTTLAALIEEINTTRAKHIITLESPVEYIFTNRHSFIRQREIPTHSPSFEQGITDALRENPDVLVISEMRTPEVMRLTLNAAETGHLVLATMHAATSAEAISRLCMSFPADIQPSVRAQLADCLVAVSCQRLEYLAAHRLRVPRCELLLPSSGAKGTIRAGNFSQIANVLQAGGEEGMWTFDRYQRWIDQVPEWVPAETPARATEESPRPLKPLVRPPPLAAPAKSPRPPVADRPAASARAAGARVAASPSEEVIDVPSEELDLASLAELAKKVVERKP